MEEESQIMLLLGFKEKLEHKFGKESLIGYYETTNYICDVKKQKLKVQKERTRRKHMYKVAVNPGSTLEQVIYLPSDKRPETFCVFSK
jgi:hypothetical protein